MAVIILAEVWKTTPFMALLLMAGLALVPEDLQKAAKVDGATAWQRFRHVTLPLMKPAILVALLFRTLDAFRIFDNIFILTAGGHDTGSVSILGYDNLFTSLNLGVGSAISVLIFICVADHRVPVHQGVRRGRARIGDEALMATTTKQKVGWGSANILVDRLVAIVPILWIVSLSFKDPATHHRRLVLARRSGPGTTTRGSSTRPSSPGPWSTRSASR